VKLTAHGKSSTQPLAIKLDPRVKTSQEALVQQFELASKLASRLGEVSTALQQAGELKKQVEARKKEAGDKPDVVKALEEVNQKLDALTETESESGFGLYGLALPGKEQEALPKVASALRGLMIVVESADSAPTADAGLASDKWETAARETLARWTAFQRDELASANRVLQNAALKPLVIGEAAAEQ
jgi:hypothetical protein